MGRIFSRAVGAALAIAVVAVVTVVLFVPPYIERYVGPFCFCIWPPYSLVDAEPSAKVWGWTRWHTAAFDVYAPRGWSLHRGKEGEIVSGVIEGPDGALQYNYRDDGEWQSSMVEVLARSGQNVVQRKTAVGGAPAKLVMADMPGSEQPYIVAVYVPRLAKRGGDWMSLSIFGRFRTSEARQLARQSIESIEFLDRPPPVYTGPAPVEREPAAPKVEPPAFDIAGPPA